MLAKIWEWLMTSENPYERDARIAELAETQVSMLQAATDLKDMADTMCSAVTDDVLDPGG